MTRFPCLASALRPCLFLLAALLAVPAHAGRPLMTDDASVMEAGECEIDSYFGRSGGRGAPVHALAWLQPGCGAIARSQVSLGLGREWAAGAWQTDASINTVALVGKTALLVGSESSPGVALAWQAGWGRPQGGPLAASFGQLAGVATLPLAPAWTAHANLGWSRAAPGGPDGLLWGLALEHALTDALDLAVEAFARDGTSAFIDGGLRWTLGDGWSVNLSWAQQPRGARANLGTLGLRYGF